MLEIELELGGIISEIRTPLAGRAAAQVARAQAGEERPHDCVSRLRLGSGINLDDRRSKTRRCAAMKPRGMPAADVFGYVDCRSNRSAARLWNSEVMKEAEAELFRMMRR